MLPYARPIRSIILGSHPWWQSALSALHRPSLELFRGAVVCVSCASGGSHFSAHATPVDGLVIPYSPLSRTGRDLALNLEVKVGDDLGVSFRCCVLAALRIRLFDWALMLFSFDTAAVDGECWRYLGL
jgi:hypothetical protein